MKLIHLRNNAIDFEKWDKCIESSHNQIMYAFSWYLDIVSPGWEALVSENYEYIMPLPTKSKYKIPYLVQPLMTQQLGIFSKEIIDEAIIKEFVDKIPYYSYELNLNEKNFHSKALVYPNYLLNLDQPYEIIQSKYSKNTRRNIDKAIKQKLTIKEGLPLEEFIEFYKSQQRSYLSVGELKLKHLLEKGVTQKAIKLYGILNSNEELIAALSILKSSKRLTYLLPVSNSDGKSSSAMFLLIDYLIKNEIGNDKVLDFEGSKIEGIARFYKGFGAKNHPYFVLKKFRPSFLIGK